MIDPDRAQSALEPTGSETAVRFAIWCREARPDAPLDLPALLIAADDRENVDLDAALDELDRLAETFRTRKPAPSRTGTQAELLASYLFEEQGFHGNREDYYDPENSFLDQVLARRTGIPITLAIVFLEVARRLGWHPLALNVPGHFMVGWLDPENPVLIDPFDGCRTSVEDCRRRLAPLIGDTPTARWLQPATTHEVLARVNRNLKQIYLRREDFVSALRCTSRSLLLLPDQPLEIRDRGLLYVHLDCPDEAVADLERFLDLAPEHPSCDKVSATVETLRATGQVVH